MNNDIISHFNYEQCFNQFSEFVSNKSDVRFILIIGLAGSGKTTMRRAVLRNHTADPLLWQPNKVPCIEVMATLPDKSYFNPRDFAFECHKQLLCPNISWRLTDQMKSMPNYANHLDEINQAREALMNIRDKKITEMDKWSAYKDLALIRGLEILSIEHADAMCVHHKDMTPADYIKNLMSINEELKTTTVLTCVQSGYKLWDERSEVSQRISFVYLMPYDLRIKFEMEQYLIMLRSLCEDYIFEPQDLIGTMAIDLAVATATSIRAIKNILVISKRNARKAGREHIIRSDIETSFASEREINKLQLDVLELREIKKHCDMDKIKEYGNKIWLGS